MKRIPPLLASLFILVLVLTIAAFHSSFPAVDAGSPAPKPPFPTPPANILIMPSSLEPMHRFTMRHLAAELVRRNHTVTWFEYGLVDRREEIPLLRPEGAKPEALEEIFLRVPTKNPKLREIYEWRNHVEVQRQLWSDTYWNEAAQSSGWLASIELCDQLLTNPSSRKVFDSLVARRFEAVVVDDLYNPCGLLHTGLQRSLFVYWSMSGLRAESAWANQSPSPPSYIPVANTWLTDELNFWQRTYNLAAYLRELYIHQHVVQRRMDRMFRRHYPENKELAAAFDMERNASINFVNHPPIFDFARPYMPRVNFVGGLHCRKAKPIEDKELAAFLDASSEKFGFILITTGFTAKWRYAPKEVVENLLAAMRALPEMRFVWQYNGPPLSDPPSNLRYEAWLPQQDLLGHPKCRVHLSHGGLNSVIESVWHGVPILGWPLTSAGYDNLLRVTARQAGRMLEHKNLTTQEWVSALNLAYLRHYRDEMLSFQDMVTDVPYTELNHSAFWVEFIVRHQEVPHARSGADELHILQYFLVDVIAFVAGVVVLASVVIYYTVKCTVRLLFRLTCALLCWVKRNVLSVGYASEVGKEGKRAVDEAIANGKKEI